MSVRGKNRLKAFQASGDQTTGALGPATMTAQSASAVPPPTAGTSSRGGALDLLRFSAAMLIMLYHFGNESPIKLYHLNPVFSRGYIATDFFLILSGYVLGRAYGPAIQNATMGWGRFWVRRASRVWPAHLIIMAAFGLYVFVQMTWFGVPANPARFAWSAFVQQALLIHAWSPINPPADGWYLPSCSLSALLFCYAAFPWAWKALVRVRPAAVLVMIGLAAIVAGDSTARALYDRPLYDLPFQLGVVRGVPLFLLGMCLAQAVALDWPSKRAARILMWGGLVVFFGLAGSGRFDFLTMAAIAAVILGAGRLPVKKPVALFETAARLSFALFITHTLVGVLYWDSIHLLISKVPIGIGFQWAMWVAGFPLAILCAFAFDKWIDQPIQDFIQPYLKTKK